MRMWWMSGGGKGGCDGARRWEMGFWLRSEESCGKGIEGPDLERIFLGR